MPHIDVGGVSLHYSEAGAGPPLVLVHGWPASGRFWDNVVPALAATHRVLALDLKGFGLSAKPADGRYEIDDLAEEVASYMRAADAWPADVVGHSMGGMISTALALRHPEAVRHLVAVSAPVHGPTSVSPVLRPMAVPIVRLVAFGLMRWRTLVAITSRLFTNGTAIPDAVLDDIMRISYHGALRSQISMQRVDLTDRLSGLRPRTLLMYGELDRVITPRQPLMAAARIPGARLHVLTDCGHCPSLERPERFLESVGAFLTT